MTKLEQIFNKDNLNHFSNIKKLEELKKIDYHLDAYIRKHSDVLKSVGNTDEQVADLIIGRLEKVLIEKEKKDE